MDFLSCVAGGSTKIVKMLMETNVFVRFALISIWLEHWLLYCE